MKAIIPVAGIGTRLRPHTHTSPKVLLAVAGKPMLAHILDELVALGFTEVTFIIGYKGDMIRDYVERNYHFKANFVEQPEMKGLGHAIWLTKQFHAEEKEPVLIVLGDTIFKADLRPVLHKKISNIGVKEVEDARRFGIVELGENGEVTRLIEKPENPPTNLAIVGIYYMTNPALLYECLDEIIKKGKTTKGEFQLTDALQLMLDRGEKMRVFKLDGWYDCGKPETMLETNRELLRMNHHSHEAVISTRYKNSIVIMPVAIGEGVTIENSIVGPNVSISARTELRSCIASETIIGENAQVTSIILKNSIISDNAKVQGNQFHLNVGDSSEIILAELPPSDGVHH